MSDHFCRNSKRLGVVAAALAALACSSGGRLDKDADAALQAWVGQHFTECDESWYLAVTPSRGVVGSEFLVEIKGLGVSPRVRKVEPVDKANGIQSIVDVYVGAEMWRFIGREWQKWEVPHRPFCSEYSLIKQGDAWRYQSKFCGLDLADVKVDCAKVASLRE